MASLSPKQSKIKSFFEYIRYHPFSFIYKSFKLILKSIFVLFLLGLLIIGLTSFYFIKQAESDINDIPALSDPSKAPLQQPIKIYDKENKLIGTTFTQRRYILSPQSIPERVKKATIAIEDQRFYKHRGVDSQAVLRALYTNYKTNDTTEGASTITMQYIRNIYLDFSKTTNRKIKEVALSLQLESVWDKERILAAYLNTVYYANGCYGIEAASRYYFNKNTNELSIAQSAFLAGIVKDPENYNPKKNKSLTNKRKTLVLEEMYAQGHINRKQLLKAKKEKIKLKKHKARNKNDLLFNFVKKELNKTLDKTDIKKGGFNVYTSLSLKTNNKANKILREVYNSKQPFIASSFIENKTGRILFISSNSKKKYFNYATDSYRQPGSVVKLYTTLEYLKQGNNLSDSINNSPLKIKDNNNDYTITPTKQDANTVINALRYSQNPAFWRLYQRSDPKKVLSLEKKLGLSKMDSNPASSLGGTKRGTNTLEIAGSLSVFANYGIKIKPHSIISIEDYLGNTVYSDKKDLERKRVVDAEYTRQLNQAAKQVVNKGFTELKQNIPLTKKYKIAGKTGTTEKNADAWFAGYNPYISGSVWTGYDNNRSLINLAGVSQVYGMTIPAKTWNKLANLSISDYPNKDFAKPKGIKEIPNLKGLDYSKAYTSLQKRGFKNIKVVKKFSKTAKANKVFKTKPSQGVFIKPNRTVTIYYQTDLLPMPDLTSLSYVQAQKEIGKYAKIKLKFIPSESESGTVINQFPLANEELKYNSVVNLEIATKRAPPKIITKTKVIDLNQEKINELNQELEKYKNQSNLIVPSVIGLSFEDAKRVLDSLTLDINLINQGEFVISQEPMPGTIVIQNGTINLTLE